MRHYIKFDLPEDEHEFQLALSGRKFYLVLSDILDMLRTKIKYEDLTEEQYKIYDEIRDKIYDELVAQGINDQF